MTGVSLGPKSSEIVQVNDSPRRHYVFEGNKYPSVTSILHACWPEKHGLIKWIGNVGNEEAVRIRDEAGLVGSIVHARIEDYFNSEYTVDFDTESLSPEGVKHLEECTTAFYNFAEKYKPNAIKTEFPICSVVTDDCGGYAGTVDFFGVVTMPNGEDVTVLLDWKTSKSLREEMKAQLVLYHLAMETQAEVLAIVHLGNSTKTGFTFSIVKQNKICELYHKARLCVNMYHAFYFKKENM